MIKTSTKITIGKTDLSRIIELVFNKKVYPQDIKFTKDKRGCTQVEFKLEKSIDFGYPRERKAWLVAMAKQEGLKLLETDEIAE